MMRRLLTPLMQLLAIIAIPLCIGLSSQVSAVEVFPACDVNNGNASQTHVCDEVNSNSSTKAKDNPIIGVISLVIMILSFIIGFAAVVMIILGGFSLITANGDAQSVAKARSGIMYALIGLVVVALAQILVAFVLNKL